MAVFGSALVQLDVSSVEQETPLMLELTAARVDRDTVLGLRSAFRAHRGTTPVRLVVCHRQRRTTLAVDDYPVTVSPALLAELRSVRGVEVVS
ncbi:MAG: hypothetical protein ABW215_00060 [Kibdelosporangium sp.]